MSDMEATTLRTWLKNIRTEKNLTQSEIAKMAGVDVTMISKIELGERRPSVEVAKKIAAVLGFNWTRFYEDDQDKAGNCL